MKETREILDKILRTKKSEYAMIDSSTSSLDQKQTKDANVLKGETEPPINGEESMEDMETYETTQELDFEVDEVKECLEKKKKRRNYIEFRSDYEKK